MAPKESTREKERRKIEVLKLLSVNSRLSLSEIAKQLGLPKPSIYNLINELTEEYGLRFVPEINIVNIWKYELIRLSKSHSKKEMLHEAVEKLQSMGFEEYLIMIKFLKKVPNDQEITKAMKGSYLPQFVARLDGEYNLMIYAVAPNYSKMALFLMDFSTMLEKYDATIVMNKIDTAKGFFPIRDELIKEFNVSSTYQKLLLELNKNGRGRFGDLAVQTKIPQQQLSYAFERLVRSGIISRITYYETKPKNVFHVLIMMKMVNVAEYLKTREKWILDQINDYEEKHDQYTFVCDVTSPFGGYVMASFATPDEFDAFFRKMKSRLKGVELKYMNVRGVLLGNLGIRNFDMRYSKFYQYMERKKHVPRFTPNAKVLYDIGDADEPLDGGSGAAGPLM